MPLEIERKFIIKKPNTKELSEMPAYTQSKIEQIYLESNIGTHRIRRREYAERIVYTETKKLRVDGMSAIEDEREISAEEYTALKSKIDKSTHPVCKIRHTFTLNEQTFEIDIYPEWTHTAILETELKDRECEVIMPSIIEIVREVTGIKAYSNASMSHTFPKEEKADV